MDTKLSGDAPAINKLSSRDKFRKWSGDVATEYEYVITLDEDAFDGMGEYVIFSCKPCEEKGNYKVKLWEISSNAPVIVWEGISKLVKNANGETMFEECLMADPYSNVEKAFMSKVLTKIFDEVPVLGLIA